MHALAGQVASTPPIQPIGRTAAPARSLRLGISTEHTAQGRALCVKRADGALQSALTLRGQPHQYDPPIRFGGRANNQSSTFAAINELGHSALAKREPVHEIHHCCLLAPVWGSLDHQQQQVPLWSQPVRARDLLTSP